MSLQSRDILCGKFPLDSDGLLQQPILTEPKCHAASGHRTIESLEVHCQTEASQMMRDSSDAPCAHCKAISPHNGSSNWGRYNIPHNRSDQYPDFPALEAGAAGGCGFCGLLRHALQDKYSDNKIVEAESHFHPSIRAQWSPTWNGQVTVGRAIFSTEEDWPFRDKSTISGQRLGDIYALSLEVWPYPPRRSDCSPELNNSAIWFAVYADSGEWQNEVILYQLMHFRLQSVPRSDLEA